MSTTRPDAPPPTTTGTADTGADARRPAKPWIRLLAWLAAIVAASDLVFFAMIGTIVPPLAAAAALTLLGLALLRRTPRIGIAVLGTTSLLMLIANLPFAVTHLTHPESAIDFTHATFGTLGRAFAVVAATGAWRRAAPVGARRLGVGAIGLAGLTVVISGIAMVASTGDISEGGDVPTVIHDSQFEDSIIVPAGDALYIDNTDLFRHTFTVVGTDVDVEVPATVGVRVPIELPAGAYDVICAIPGHEFMTATLEVQ